MEKIQEIYEKHYKWMLGLANSILKNHHDSEDTVMKAFEKILRYRRKLDGVESNKTKAFLAIVVKSVAYTELKRTRKRMEDGIETVPLSYVAPDVLDIVLTRDNYFRVVDAMSKLSEPDKSILVLRLHFNLEFKEIADIVNLNDDNVRKRFQRARLKLADILRKGGR